MRGEHRGVWLTDSPLQILLVILTIPSEDSPRRLPYKYHDAEVANPRVPPIGHEGLPEIVKGGVAHAGCTTCPLKRMRNAGNMIALGPPAREYP